MAGYLTTLKLRDYRLLWIGSTVSTFGDAMTLVALTWLVLSQSGPTGVGWLVFAFGAPVVIGGLLTGRILARFGVVRTLFTDSLIRAVIVSSVPVAELIGHAPRWLPFVVAVSYGLAKMIPLAGVPTLIPDLVDSESLNAANALETISYGAGSVAGPALAGAMLAFLSPGSVLAVDAASFVVFAICLKLMQRQVEVVSGTSDGIGVMTALRFIVRCAPIRSTTLMFAGCNIGLGTLAVVLPVYAVNTLKVGAAGFGTMTAALAAGELLGAAAAGVWPVRRNLGRAIAGTQLATGLAACGLLLHPQLIATCIVLALVGAFSAPMTIWAQTIRMALVPSDLRGHVFALLRTTMQAGAPAGGVVGGAAISGGIGLATALSAAWLGLPGAVGLVAPSLSDTATAPPAARVT
ncbi:MFS transporter [Kribbella kalugense]|uniref:Transmembrane secretion effector n=1 Tax=Kribbella kalugense TaxID=2512221 RepID=A0A4R8A250_9ACTN|nr:MFS transporter [Kribbella kalugense]TDW24286.1 transmembrane secretion effector [Kribbella kalugense]